MPTLNLFHSSLTPEINEFHPLSHFGSRKQAIIVAKNKIARMRKNPNEVEAYLYEVEIIYSAPSEIFMIEDGGSPRPRMLLINYAEAFEKGKNYHTHLRESNAYAEENGINPDIEARNRIFELAKKNKHTIFSYENTVEVDKEDNISYCVISPDSIKIIRSEKINPSELEK